MPSEYSFRSRLLFSFFIVILLALIPPAWYARQTFNAQVIADAEETALRNLRFVRLIVDERRDDFAGLGDFRTALSEISKELGIRISYISEDGRLLSDSIPTGITPDGTFDLETMPEVDAALHGSEGVDIRTHELGGSHVHAAVKMKGGVGLPPGILHISIPSVDIEGQQSRHQRKLVIIFLMALTLAAILSRLLIRHMSASMAEMIRVATAIGKGGYSNRMRIYPGKEFNTLAQTVNYMAERIESHIRTITEQKGEVEAILNGMREGVMVLDASGRIRKVNQTLGRIFPGSSEAVGRKPLEIISSPELQDACDIVLAESSDSPDRPYNLQIEPSKNKSYDVNIVRLNRDQNGIGAILVFHDISEIKRLERIRRDFVANVSHELRTPLTTVKGYAETLLAGESINPITARSFLEVILKNADHMTKMVEDLLNLSRLEGGSLRIAKNRVNAGDALMEAFRACAALADEKQITLDNTLPEDGVYVLSDFDRLVQVFRNLLENAVKYGPVGSAITATYEDRNNMAVFGIADSGPGIPKEEQSRIFERFYRVEKHRKKSSNGSTGLGLAICKHLVERLGGSIWLQSPADGGSVFYFSMPQGRDDRPGVQSSTPVADDRLSATS